MIVIEHDNNSYSMHFARFASRLETYLLKYGVTCHDADMIIEESSILYFEKLNSPNKRLFKLIKRREPAKIFIQSALKAIEKYIPEANHTFGSFEEISKCILQASK
jgi:hypothetical protein